MKQIKYLNQDQNELRFTSFNSDIIGLLFEDGRKFDLVFPVHGPNREWYLKVLEIMDG